MLKRKNQRVREGRRSCESKNSPDASGKKNQRGKIVEITLDEQRRGRCTPLYLGRPGSDTRFLDHRILGSRNGEMAAGRYRKEKCTPVTV